MDLSLLGLWDQMGGFAKGIVFVLAIMSIYSLTIMVSEVVEPARRRRRRRRKFAPEFSQFLEEDNLTEAIKLAESYKKSHVARVLGGALGEVKPLIQDGSVTVADINSAERAVERNMLLEITDLKRGLARARDGRRHGAVRRTARHDDGHRERLHGHGRVGLGRSRRDRGRYRRGAHHDGVRSARRDPGGVGVQLLPDQDRQPHGRDDVHLEGDDRLPHQGRVGRVRPVALHP